MEELERRHRKELKDLQAVITQKKKAASKKNRKAVNSECTDLELRLQAKQSDELAALEESSNGEVANGVSRNQDGQDEIGSSEEGLSKAFEQKVILDQGKKTPPVAESSKVVSQVGNDTAPRAKKPNRQKARLARRAAEQESLAEEAAKEAALLPNLREQEKAAMEKSFEKYNLVEQDILPNGHCLYSSIADQLKSLPKDFKTKCLNSISPPVKGEVDYKTIRKLTGSFMEEHRTDFEPFLEEPIESHVDKVKNTAEWGGQLELLAVAKALNIQINVLQADDRIEKISSSDGPPIPEEEIFWLAYYRHSYGLGEHYNSLRKKKT